MPDAGQATDPAVLRAHIMDPNVPKSEAEHWAARRIAELEESGELTSVGWPNAIKIAYHPGDKVLYRDRHDRVQTGEVEMVEARLAFTYGIKPCITYTLTHPSYRDNRMYAGGEVIIRKIEDDA